MRSGHGHGHGSSHRTETSETNELNQRLLVPVSSNEQQQEENVERLQEFLSFSRRLRGMLALVTLIDVLCATALYWHFMGEHNEENGHHHYRVEESVLDVWVAICVKSLFTLFLSVLGNQMTLERINFVYWIIILYVVLLVSKCIAFDWKQENELKPMMLITFALSLVQTSISDRIYAHHSDGEALNPRITPAVANGLQEKEPASLSKWSMLVILRPYFWPNTFTGKLRCFLTWIFLAISKVTNLIAPIYIGRAVQLLSNAQGDDDIDKVYLNVIYFSFLTFASKSFRELQSVVYLRVKQHAYAEIAEQTFVHLHSLSLEWHLKKKMGNILRSMDRGVSAADTVVSYLFLYLVPSAIEAIVVFVIFYSHYNIPALSATAFLSLVLYCIATVKITLWRSKFRTETNKHDNDYHDKATDSLVNYETVKYFTAEEFETKRYKAAIVKFQKYSVGTQMSLSVLNSTQNIIIQACAAVGLCIAGYHVLDADHDFSVGDFVSVNVFILNMFAPLSFLGTIYNAIIQAIVDMKNLSELLAENPDVKDSPDAQDFMLQNSNSAVSFEFRDVYFHYPTQLKSSGLQGVSFKIEAGTETAVVGHTGSGKTTISRLAFRFYDPLSGQILINDLDISKLTQKSLRKAIGVVPQDTVLFNDTILYNLQYGAENASREEIERACEAAQILEFIQGLPNGFDTPVGERGLKLSGGEKQRVAIARCLLKNPPMVILDEATSALDSRTEQSVQRALHDLTNSRTTLVIAHRLSTIKAAHQIVVLDSGRVVEKGKHDSLILNPNSYYAKLWNTQLRMQTEGEENHS